MVNLGPNCQNFHSISGCTIGGSRWTCSKFEIILWFCKLYLISQGLLRLLWRLVEKWVPLFRSHRKGKCVHAVDTRPFLSSQAAWVRSNIHQKQHDMPVAHKQTISAQMSCIFLTSEHFSEVFIPGLWTRRKGMDQWIAFIQPHRKVKTFHFSGCLLYTSPSPRD